jgi:hypothetical protein
MSCKLALLLLASAISASLAAVISASPAAAGQSGFVSMGSMALLPDPACASDNRNLAVCAARAFDSGFAVDRYNGAKWDGWARLDAVVSSSPSCAKQGAGRVLCAARGEKGDLVYALFNGARWSAPASVAGPFASAPSCANFTGAEVLCVARGATGAMLSRVYNGRAWSALMTSAAVGIVSAPTCVADDGGNADCLAISRSNTALGASFQRTNWGTASDRAGLVTTELGCGQSFSPGFPLCLARGSDSQPYYSLFFGTEDYVGFLGWMGLGGTVVSKASCANNQALEIVCAALDTGSALTVDIGSPDDTALSGIKWAGFSRVGGSFVGAPSCVTIAYNTVLCAAVDAVSRGESNIFTGTQF